MREEPLLVYKTVPIELLTFMLSIEPLTALSVAHAWKGASISQLLIDFIDIFDCIGFSDYKDK